MPELEIILLCLWGVIVIICLAIEFASTSFIAIWFAFGGLIALIFTIANFAWYWQLLAFLAVSLLSLMLGYPFLRTIVTNKKNTKTNVEALINQNATMINDYNSSDSSNIGLAKLDGKTWTVINKEQVKFQKNEEVMVTAISGVKLVIKKIRSEN